MNKSTN